MFKIIKTLTTLIIVASLFTLSSCKDDDDTTTPVDKTGKINFYLDHNVGGEDLEFENIIYDCAAGHKFSVVRLKYYTSNFKLHTDDGSTYDVEGEHYRDAAEASTRGFSWSDVPAGDYNKISFTFGLDAETNVDGGLAATQTNINMEWPIPGDEGYHNMKFEGKYDSLAMGVVTKNFNLHSGQTMGNDNSFNVELNLPSDASINDNTWGIYLEMDLNQWLEDPANFDFETYGPMIMMNQTAQEALKANGASIFSVVKSEKE